VVWKTLRKEDINSLDQEQLVKEFKHQKKLNHPNIVKTFGLAAFELKNGLTFGIVMEYMDGKGLDESEYCHIVIVLFLITPQLFPQNKQQSTSMARIRTRIREQSTGRCRRRSD